MLHTSLDIPNGTSTTNMAVPNWEHSYLVSGAAFSITDKNSRRFIRLSILICCHQSTTVRDARVSRHIGCVVPSPLLDGL